MTIQTMPEDFEYEGFKQSETSVNLKLARDKKLSHAEIKHIEVLQQERFDIREKLKIGELTPTKTTGKRLFEIDKLLVAAWNFDTSHGSYYKPWEEPTCICPNEGTPWSFRHAHRNCPLHGID